MALTDKLTAIADAIRAKTGNTEELTLEQMASEIENFSTSGDFTIKGYLTARAGDGYQFYNANFNDDTFSTLLSYGDTSSVTNMTYMFNGCKNITTIPQIDTSAVTNMSGMFFYCTNLTTIPQLDTSAVTNMTDVVYNCVALTDCYLRNIKRSLQVGSGTKWGHLLTLESLLYMIGELVNVGVSRTFTVGSANLAKLADIYVKTIEITDDMRAADRLIDSKMPFEVCESTDDVAILISDYVLEKNWQLA